jgi:hypothetical protein
MIMERKNDSRFLKFFFYAVANHAGLVGRRQTEEGEIKLTQLYGIDPQFKEAVDIVLAKVFAAFPPDEDGPCSDPDCLVHGERGFKDFKALLEGLESDTPGKVFEGRIASLIAWLRKD